MKLLYKLSKASSSSMAKLVERKLESLFVRRKALVFKALKQHEKHILKRENVVGELVSTIQRVMHKRGHVYSIFYMLKHKSNDQRRLV